MKTKLTTGERIDDLLREKGESITEAARKIGVSPSLLSEIRNTDESRKKERKIGSENLIKFCDYFQVSADYLLGLSETRSLDVSVQSVQKNTGISEKAAYNLTKNAGGWWTALSAVLESELFWQFLELMETYKNAGTKGNNIGDYVGKGIESVARRLIPEPEAADMQIFKEEFFKSVCARYCWLLMEEYKKSSSDLPAK